MEVKTLPEWFLEADIYSAEEREIVSSHCAILGARVAGCMQSDRELMLISHDGTDSWYFHLDIDNKPIKTNRE